jgi:hypothetical protein
VATIPRTRRSGTPRLTDVEQLTEDPIEAGTRSVRGLAMGHQVKEPSRKSAATRGQRGCGSGSLRADHPADLPTLSASGLGDGQRRTTKRASIRHPAPCWSIISRCHL